MGGLFFLSELDPLDGSVSLHKREIAEVHGPPVPYIPGDFAEPNHGGYHSEIANIGAICYNYLLVFVYFNGELLRRI